jgi:hypothetical protein
VRLQSDSFVQKEETLTPSNNPPPEPARLRWKAGNLLLAIPFLGLVTPLFNRTDPVLFGWPFYYWGYLVAVLVGCALIAGMIRLTRDQGTEAAPPAVDR